MDPSDFRWAKRKENKLRRENLKAKKNYYKKRLNTNLGKWKELKNITEEEDKSLMRIVENKLS